MLNPPSLSTSSVTEITETSVTVGGNITNDGGALITERGLVWGLNANPTTGDNKQTVGTGTGSFTTSIDGLESNTTYFVRAYANSEGAAYGSQQQFSTLEPAPVQKIFEGDVYLTTQQEVDDFGEEKYSEIKGKLFVGVSLGKSDIVSLENLSTLTELGSLDIENNELLETLDGLDNIVKINEDLNIYKNDSLISLDALNSLSYLDGSLSIHFCNNLEILNNFNQVSEIEYVYIANNENLKRVGGFETLQITDQVYIRNNDTIESVTGFSNLTNLRELYVGLWKLIPLMN